MTLTCFYYCKQKKGERATFFRYYNSRKNYNYKEGSKEKKQRTDTKNDAKKSKIDKYDNLQMAIKKCPILVLQYRKKYHLKAP